MDLPINSMHEIAVNPGDIELVVQVWWKGLEMAFPADSFNIIQTFEDPESGKVVEEGYVELEKWLAEEQKDELKQIMVRDTTFKVTIKNQNRRYRCWLYYPEWAINRVRFHFRIIGSQTEPYTN